MAYRVLICDDEKPARDELQYLMEQHDDMLLVGEAESGEEALDFLNRQTVDIVFLDIHMPGMDGITAAEGISRLSQRPYIVFSTAYDQHAVKAFELNAVDYLLKPYDADRLAQTVEKIRERTRKSSLDPALFSQFLEQFEKKDALAKTQKVSKISIETEDRVIFLDPDEITWVESDGRKTIVKTCKTSYTTKMTLQSLEERLIPYGFIRTHRSYLVNLDYISELTPWFNGTYNLTLGDPKKSVIPVSRTYLKGLREIYEI
jgi:two-component system response regulator LytT